MSSQTIIINPKVRHTATVIFLHGLGDTGHGWSEALREIALPYVKYICPTAPVIPVTLNAGFRMPSWFDLFSLSPGGQEDENGIKEQAQKIQTMIHDEEKNGISSNRIVIGGFSQGGALALYSALTMSKPLGGILALSCWLPLHSTFPGVLKGNNSTKILQCHGDSDPMIPHRIGQMTGQELKRFCSDVEFKSYSGLGHGSNTQEMKDVRDWISKVLPQA